MTTTTTSRVEGNVAPLKPPTLGWALRRTLLAILILVFAMGGAAWLLYASIDPEEEGAPTATSSSRASPAVQPQSGPPAPAHRV